MAEPGNNPAVNTLAPSERSFNTLAPPERPFNTFAAHERSSDARLSDDLTVILLRGNGSPRTFRLSVPALQRSLTGLGFAFALAIAASLILLLWNLLHFSEGRNGRDSGERVEIAAPAPAPALPAPAAQALSPAPAPTPTSAAPAKPGFWGSLSGESGKDDVDLRKEMQGLRDDIAKLSADANGRRDLAPGVNAGLLQFFGPRNVADADATIQVKNVKVSRTASEVTVDFEVTNVDPQQRQVRGYIVVLAKTPNFLLSYPEGAFNPDQNVVLDYTKGETFGVSRLRPTRATFPAALLEGKKPRFQILLFSSGSGKVIADLHVEGN